VGGYFCSFVAEVVGVPKPGVKWYHNKSLLELDERVQIEQDGDKFFLEITNVQKADGGQYLCHAVNIVGEAKSIAQVEVLSEDGRSLALPPPVTHQHVIHFDLDVRCAPGFSAVFEYTVAGEPCPDVLWFKGSEQLSSDARCSVVHHPDGSGSLTVQQCTEEDTGLYTCRAVNVLGEATCSAELLVLPEEHAVCRQSPTLQHSAVAEDQSPLSYEEAGDLPAMEGALVLLSILMFFLLQSLYVDCK
uniref:Ig-like domain-containing protein n=1 Tax=Falco tinnunculus TaxID=100819 RepID=A0A8C4ULE7_FALTI